MYHLLDELSGYFLKHLKVWELLLQSGVVKINDKKKEEFKLLQDFFSDYYKSFHEHLFAENRRLECSKSPDFIVKFDNQKIGVELTRAIDEKIMNSEVLKIKIYKIVRKYINDALSKRKVYPIMQTVSTHPSGKKPFSISLRNSPMRKWKRVLPC